MEAIALEPRIAISPAGLMAILGSTKTFDWNLRDYFPFEGFFGNLLERQRAAFTPWRRSAELFADPDKERMKFIVQRNFLRKCCMKQCLENVVVC